MTSDQKSRHGNPNRERVQLAQERLWALLGVAYDRDFRMRITVTPERAADLSLVLNEIERLNA